MSINIDLSELEDFSFNKLMLDEFQDRFVELFECYREAHKDQHGRKMEKKVLGDIIGLSATHMTKLTKKKTGSNVYQMRLSGNYLWPCILKGVCRMSDFQEILDKKEAEGSLGDQEKHFFYMAKLQEIIREYNEIGVDPLKTLEEDLIKIKRLKELIKQ